MSRQKASYVIIDGLEPLIAEKYVKAFIKAHTHFYLIKLQHYEIVKYSCNKINAATIFFIKAAVRRCSLK